MDFLPLIVGNIIIFLLRYRTEDRTLLIPIQITAAVLAWSNVLIQYENFPLLPLRTIGGAFLIMYGVRFYRKPLKNLMAYLKLTAVLFYGLWTSIMFPTIPGVNPMLLDYLPMPFAFTIYFYDRLVMAEKNYKTKFIVYLVIQTVLIAMMLVYALVARFQEQATFARAEDEKVHYVEVESICHDRIKKLEEQLQSLEKELAEIRK